MAAKAHRAVTAHPVVENVPSKVSMRVPVFSKNTPKTLICANSAIAVIISMSKVSTALSVTTVPTAFGNDTPS